MKLEGTDLSLVLRALAALAERDEARADRTARRDRTRRGVTAPPSMDYELLLENARKARALWARLNEEV